MEHILCETCRNKDKRCFCLPMCSCSYYIPEEDKDENILDKFLDELAALTKKYSISICGCGCCHSPWLEDENHKFIAIANDLTWDSESGKYTYSK